MFLILWWTRLSVCLQLNENARGALHIRLVSLGNLRTDRSGSKVGLNCSIHSSLASVQFSSVQSLSCVWLFETPWLQQARPPCPSPTPGVYTNSCPLSQSYHPTTLSLSSPSPPTFNLSQHQGLFKWVSSSHQVAKVLEFQLQHQSF